jgi:hypothetical protein
MASNGYRRKEAVQPELASVNEVMHQGGRARPKEGMPSVQKAMRQGGKDVTKNPGPVPLVNEVMRQGGRSK